ncbi:MAG: UDP-N-acetylmuramate--L-alanine ligase [Minisyncoccales bacterium]
MKIFFVGIGGIAISAVARYYKALGHEVGGSDEEKSEITEELKREGIKVFTGHKKTNLWVFSKKDSAKPDLDFIVFSEAVPLNNVELKTARYFSIPFLSGAQAIAQLTKGYFLIAVSGMHGKSTTASMIAQILERNRLDPTFIIGTKPNFRLGKSQYFVLEADDYQAKFLNYYPDVLVLTNIEKEHLDYFKNLRRIQGVFRRYLGQVKKAVIANADNMEIRKLLSHRNLFHSFQPQVILYSLRGKEGGEIKNILPLPGKHNISNALAAFKTAQFLGLRKKNILEALSQYQGIWRRLEERQIGPPFSAIVISDYAHHPTEIQATCEALQEKYGGRKICLFFQPHQYQRTFYLFSDFIKTFQEMSQKCFDKIFITDVYSVKGREDKSIKQKVNSSLLVKKIFSPKVQYIPKRKLLDYAQSLLGEMDVFVFMGAGDIHKFFQIFCKHQKEKR